MRLLLIDNGTSYLSQLTNLLKGHTFEIIKYSEIGLVDRNNFDAVVLSGGHDFPVKGNVEKLKEEIDFVGRTQLPIFGICFGFEVIAHVFGATLELMRKKEQGVIEIEIIKPELIFENIPNFKVFESHRWVVREPLGELVAIASSRDGIEAFKHKTKPIYGVQFHPEMFLEKTCGDEIFNNFINLVK